MDGRIFVCLEGIDAAGKQTQSKVLAKKLDAELFSFPDYSTRMGHLIRGHLQGYWTAQPVPGATGGELFGGDPSPRQVALLNAQVFQALQTSNRMERVADLAKFLRRNRNVVSDRYWPSAAVYGAADGLDQDYLIDLHTYLPQPDLFLLLDIDPKDSVGRRPERRDRYEKEADYMGKAAALYRELWHRMSNDHANWRIIDARGSFAEVEGRIWSAVSEVRGR